MSRGVDPADFLTQQQRAKAAQKWNESIQNVQIAEAMLQQIDKHIADEDAVSTEEEVRAVSDLRDEIKDRLAQARMALVEAGLGALGPAPKLVGVSTEEIARINAGKAS